MPLDLARDRLPILVALPLDALVAPDPHVNPVGEFVTALAVGGSRAPKKRGIPRAAASGEDVDARPCSRHLDSELSAR